MLKRDSLTRSVVGLRIFTFGAISVLPFAFPAMIRIVNRLRAKGKRQKA
jgi:hypothetical protein